jgi:hypothetical protein
LLRELGPRIRWRLTRSLLGSRRRFVPSDKPGRAPRLLLVAWYDPWGLGTIVDNVAALARESRFRVDQLNLFFCPSRSGLFELPKDLRLGGYDGVLLHPTVCYNPDNLFSLDASRTERLCDFRGVKVMLKQDEHFRTGRVVEYLAQTRFDVLATCLELDEAERVYPMPRLPGLRLLHVLTGYVSDEMLTLAYPPTDRRPIDVGYRGSLQPWHFGRLAYEKRVIGDQFLARGSEHGLWMDISSRWEDRYFGREWYDFLGRCKATLGVESGASLFDFDGEVERRSAAYLRDHLAATFEELEERVLRPYNGNVRYRAISPRHFEAAACRTVQILFEGNYQGIFRPWEHYLPLRRDFGNFDEVLRSLRDRSTTEPMLERAFAEIVANPAYHYRSFVGRLDETIEQALATR